MFRVTGRIRINHKQAVHAFVQMPGQRQCMAMIKMAAEWLCIEFINELFARVDDTGPWHAVHPRRMDPMEMQGMRVRSIVLQSDLEAVSLSCPQCRPRYPAVIGPGREHYTRRDLNFLLFDGDFEAALFAPVGKLANDAAYTNR